METVIIYHNVQLDGEGRPSGLLDGYQPGDAVAPVFTYAAEVNADAPLGTGNPWRDEADRAFRIGNAPEYVLMQAEIPLQRRYYGNRIRSVSVGDVIQVGPELFACARFGGWVKVDGLNIQPDPRAPEVWGTIPRSEMPGDV